jgi:SAM-dependent methyltransferase
MSLTRAIHDKLIADGLMQQEEKIAPCIVPDRNERLVVPTANGHSYPTVSTYRPPKRQPKKSHWRRIKTLNLIYHVWPVASNDLWKWNVAQLLKRVELFDGKRTVAIVTDEETVSAKEVKKEFDGHRVEFLELENSVQLREAGTILKLLDTVLTTDRSEATFYAHAKGVSRARNVHAVEKKWAECMYHYCLDFPERVIEALSRKAMYGVSFQIEKVWIYPGTFWWFHNTSLFEQPGWNQLSNPVTTEGKGWAVESLPNRLFHPEECERVYPSEVKQLTGSQFGLYDPRLWKTEVRAPSLNERAKWRWGHSVEKEWLTWGKILTGDNILAGVGRHAKLAHHRILEVGPGYGRFYKSLLDKRAPIAGYVGVDLSPQRSRELRQKYGGSHARFVWGDVESVKDIEPLGQFDVIVATLVFKRLCPTFQLAATVCRSALVPDGKLIFDVPETGIDWPASEEAQVGQFEAGWGFGAFAKSYTQEEIRELLDTAGFADVRFDSIVHDGDKRRLLVIARRP